jgi:hypothetical protein
MKRVLTILAILLLPLSVWAMTPVNDSDLSNVTGQAGVSINMDVSMNIAIGTLAWGDSTGVDFSIGGGWHTIGTTGWVGINNFTLNNLNIKYRSTDTFGGFTTSQLKFLTIDVATDATDVMGYTAAGTTNTFVRIGLGSLVISTDSMAFDVALGSTHAISDNALGHVGIGAMTIYISPRSYLDISNGGRAGAGVTLGVNVIVDQFTMSYLSWGGDGTTNSDINGLPADWIAAASGLTVAAPITMSGIVNIDVGTVNGSSIYMLNPGKSYVHISFGKLGLTSPGAFGGFVVSTGPISASVTLSANRNLSAGTVLGDIYLSSFNLDIARGSWVDILAH